MRSRPKTPVLPRKAAIQARAQSTVEAILEAAARILAEGGPQALNTNAIAKRAGVSIGSLYEYFPSKEAVVIALARQQQEGDRQAVMDALETSAGKSVSERAREAVRALIRAHHTDERVRRVTMTTHLAHGFWEEHEIPVRAVAEVLAADDAFGKLSPVALFVLTRSIVGAVRAAARQQPDLLGNPEFEEQLVRLVGGFLG